MHVFSQKSCAGESKRIAQTRRGFTLIELLVVVAIIGVLIGLLLPAVQSIRETARQTSCKNNLKQIASGCQQHVEAFGEYPYARKYDVWNTYTWTQLILPFIDEEPLYRKFYTLIDRGFSNSKPGPVGPDGNDDRLRDARHAKVPCFFCPSDQGPVGNELDSKTAGYWRTNYRGCTGSGDMYGDPLENSEGPWGKGMFAVNHGQSFDQSTTFGTHSGDVTDGLSKTILAAEGLVPLLQPGPGGPIGGWIYGNMGGSLCSAALTPNSPEADKIYGKCPQSFGDGTYQAGCESISDGSDGQPCSQGAYTAARSWHPGGVCVVMADGSTHFILNDIDPEVWRGLGTRNNGELLEWP